MQTTTKTMVIVLIAKTKKSYREKLKVNFIYLLGHKDMSNPQVGLSNGVPPFGQRKSLQCVKVLPRVLYCATISSSVASLFICMTAYLATLCPLQFIVISSRLPEIYFGKCPLISIFKLLVLTRHSSLYSVTLQSEMNRLEPKKPRE